MRKDCFCFVAAAWVALSSYVQALVMREIYPDIYFIQNDELGIHEYNYFSHCEL